MARGARHFVFLAHFIGASAGAENPVRIPFDPKRTCDPKRIRLRCAEERLCAKRTS